MACVSGWFKCVRQLSSTVKKLYFVTHFVGGCVHVYCEFVSTLCGRERPPVLAKSYPVPFPLLKGNPQFILKEITQC